MSPTRALFQSPAITILASFAGLALGTALTVAASALHALPLSALS